MLIIQVFQVLRQKFIRINSYIVVPVSSVQPYLIVRIQYYVCINLLKPNDIYIHTYIHIYIYVVPQR